MNQVLILKKPFVEKLEIGVTFILLLYYLGVNVPDTITQTWALFGFLAIPLLIVSQWKRYIWVITRDLPLILLTILVPISVLWSTTPSFTLAYSRAFLSSTAFGIYLATRYSLKEQMRLLVCLFGTSIALNFIIPLLVPSYGVNSGSWQGITRHKNELSAAMALFATFFLNNALYNTKLREFSAVASGIAFFVLLRTQGKGSLGIFFALMILIPLYKIVKQEYKLKTCLAISAIFIALVVIAAVVFNFEFIIVDLLKKDMGFNGRDKVWEYLIDRGLQRPWLGYGYAGFWSNPDEGLGVAVRFPWIGGAGEGGGNAHSNYMDIFLQLGWSGLGLVFLSFFTTLPRVVFLLALTRQREFFWMLQCILFLAITSVYESYGGFLAYRHLFWVLYVMCVSSSAIYFHRLSRRKA
jgi:exopolysaccharide production protein ExoQ